MLKLKIWNLIVKLELGIRDFFDKKRFDELSLRNLEFIEKK